MIRMVKTSKTNRATRLMIHKILLLTSSRSKMKKKTNRETKTNHRKNRDKKIKALKKAPSLNKKKMTNQQETRKNKR